MKTGRRKPCSRSIIHALKPEQRAELEKWLVDQNCSLTEAAKRCQTEFGVRPHRTTLGRYYPVAVQERTMNNLLNSAAFAEQIENSLGARAKKTFKAIVAIMGQLAFNCAIDAEGNKKHALKKFREQLDLLIPLREEFRLDEKFFLEREKWEFDVARTCHEHFEELQKIIANKSLDEPSRLQAIRQRLFGDNLAPDDRDPNKKPPA